MIRWDHPITLADETRWSTTFHCTFQYGANATLLTNWTIWENLRLCLFLWTINSTIIGKATLLHAQTDSNTLKRIENTLKNHWKEAAATKKEQKEERFFFNANNSWKKIFSYVLFLGFFGSVAFEQEIVLGNIDLILRLFYVNFRDVKYHNFPK